ncbi:MAG: glycosyltransferase [Gammaproteobacteria bacterium]|nr:glycosyltransferase [Gammaproteobacteria bacterium]
MKILKESARIKPKISLVLLDWSVRESFHFLHYLGEQTLPRDQFEVIFVEYYATISSELKVFEHQLDSWVILDMPVSSYYHKHLMYNVGLFYAKGDIIVICDSDAMVKPGFLQTIVSHFESHPSSVLHLDQFRNNRRDFYPFNYPSFEEVEGEGCINYIKGKTEGLVLADDPLHRRNYGACFCAKREDLIAIGGADEHVDFVGYICGPYDLTLRLINLGRAEVWHETEFLYHTWHPGQAGENNYLGPHDGRHLSTTSLEMLVTRATEPHVKNKAIAALQRGDEATEKELIHSETEQVTRPEFLTSADVKVHAENTYHTLVYKGFLIQKKQDQGYEVYSLLEKGLHLKARNVLPSLAEAKKSVDFNVRTKVLTCFSLCLTYLYRIKKALHNRKQKKQREQAQPIYPSTEIPQKITKREMIKKMFYRVKQLRAEVYWLNASTHSLIMNLRLLKKKPEFNHAQLLVHGRREEVIMKFLFFLRIVPAIKIKRFDTFDEMRRICAAQEEQVSILFLVSRELYFQFASGFSQSLAKSLVVL